VFLPLLKVGVLDYVAMDVAPPYWTAFEEDPLRVFEPTLFLEALVFLGHLVFVGEFSEVVQG
jgi:hypothetical protein